MPPESLAPLEPAAENPGPWPPPSEGQVLNLVREARAATEEQERRELAGRLNRMLEELARGGGSREAADIFHGLLEGGTLEGLEDEQGRSCRAAAVESLLSLGFPYALEVRPEDLEVLRPPTSRGDGRNWRKDWPAPAVALGGVFGQLGLEVWREGPMERTSLALLALTLFTLMGVVLGPPGSALWKVGRVALVAVSLMGILLALISGYPGLVVGLAGLVAAFLAGRREG